MGRIRLRFRSPHNLVRVFLYSRRAWFYNIRGDAGMRWLRLIGLATVCLGAGAFGAIFTTPNIETWYRAIEKPAWTPPDWVFGPVWTALYLMMAIAAWLVWERGMFRREVQFALTWFAVQLILNAAWSPAFFGLRSPVAGLIIIVPLFIAVAGTTAKFMRINRWAGLLMIPYLAWSGFALVLNAAILRMNY